MIADMKARAKRLRTTLNQTHALEVTHSQALEMIARSENYPNWDAARGSLAKKTAEPSMSLPDDHVWQRRQTAFQRSVSESLSALGLPSDWCYLTTPEAVLNLEAALQEGKQKDALSAEINHVPGLRDSEMSDAAAMDARKQLGFLLM